MDIARVCSFGNALHLAPLIPAKDGNPEGTRKRLRGPLAEVRANKNPRRFPAEGRRLKPLLRDQG